MLNYRTLKVGDKVHMHAEESDGIVDVDGIITEVAEDHAIMVEADGTTSWIDDDFADMFTKQG